MTNWGVVTLKDKPISNQSLDAFFRNCYYTGILIDPWSGDEHQGRHVPMVSKEDFARVQQIIKRRNRSIPHQKHRPEFPLRGLLRCSRCLHYMTASFSRGYSQRYPYYHCGRRQCASREKSCPVRPVHNEFEAFLEHVAPKPELVERLADVMVQVTGERQAFVKTKKARLESELARLNKEIHELIRMRAQGLITDEEFVTQKSVLTERRTALESRTTPERLSEEEIRQNIKEITQPLTQLKATWHELPDPFRRQFEHFLLPAGFENQKVRTAELGLLFNVFGDFSEQNPNGVALVRKCWNGILQEISGLWGLLKHAREEKGASKETVRRNPEE